MHGQRSVIPPDASQPLKQAAVHLMLHVSRETQNVGGYPVEELDEPDQLVAEIEAERRETNDYTQTIMDDYQ
jgi:hypothetical protein